MRAKFQLLLLSAAIAASSMAQANGVSEVEQLRQEVQELRQLVQQYGEQQRLTQHQVQTVQNQVVMPKTEAQKKPSGLGLTVGGAEVKLYGNVRADASYQIQGGPDARPYNQIANVPLEGDPTYKDRFKSTLAATRLGLDFKAPVNDANVTGKIEVDFLGSGDALRIRHAYLTYNDWLIGQTWSNFAVPDYIPDTVDAMTYTGGAIKRTPQIRHTTKFSPETNLVVALEDPKDSSSNLRLPALTARLNHKVMDNMQVGVRAMVNEKRTDADTTTAWGVGVGTKLDITPSTTLKADYYHVKGDGSFILSTNPGFAQDADKNIVAENEFDSIILGVTQKFNEQWRGTLGYGYMQADDNENYLQRASGNLNKELWQTWANVFYSPSKPVSLGLEYTMGERETFSRPGQPSRTGEDQRVNMVAIYNF